MTARRLFVSQSSRLDDVEHAYPDQEHHWKLLADICRAIHDKYDDGGNAWVEVLATWVRTGRAAWCREWIGIAA